MTASINKPAGRPNLTWAVGTPSIQRVDCPWKAANRAVSVSDRDSLYDQMAIQPLLPVRPIEPPYLNLTNQSSLIRYEEVRVMDKENQIVAARMGTIHFDVIVEFFRDVLAVVLVTDVLRVDNEPAGCRGEIFDDETVGRLVPW